jgi:hypothetical protein
VKAAVGCGNRRYFTRDIRKIKMKKIFWAGLFILMMTGSIFGETPAGHLRGYHESYAYLVVLGIRLDYFLYNTYSYHNGDGEPLVRAFIAYADRRGWTVDYSNYKKTYNDVPESIKSMMNTNISDVAMNLMDWGNRKGELYIYNYDAEENVWSTEFYPLKK